MWAQILGSGVSCQAAGRKLFSSSNSCIFLHCFVLLVVISAVSNYWISALMFNTYSASWRVSWNQISKMRRGLCLGGRESSREGFWRFSTSEEAQRAAPPVCWLQKLLFLSQRTLGQSNLDLRLYLAEVRTAVGLITWIHEEIVTIMCLGNIKSFPDLGISWVLCVTYLLTYAKHTYFITCLCCNNENYFCLWL